MRARSARLAVALAPAVAVVITLVLSVGAATATAEPAPRQHRVSLGSWLLLAGSQPTIGLELTFAHRLPTPDRLPGWVSWGVALGAVDPVCDSVNCDASETRLFAGAGIRRCTGAVASARGWLCGVASLELGGARQVRGDRVRDRMTALVRAYAELGGRVRLRIGPRLELPPPPSVGDFCMASFCGAGVGVDLGLVVEL
ncbi:MAG: hypothetical protein HS111_34005 [Kofleriaceae bacterium]|nr:hypothetical protein [Kofleriaceae bacterium]MCL4225978.1 hypothetical protein [Myxococcales bacterium]